MNSFVSVEEQEVSCDDFDSFVFSASNISGSSVDSDRKSENDLNFSSNEFLSPSSDNSPTASSNNLVLCMAQSKASQNRTGGSGEFAHNVGLRPRPNTRRKSKCDSGIDIDSKLIPLEVGENYDGSSAVDIDCLPLETLLMNYPEEIDCVSLNEKDLNIENRLFESDLESDSFDGFSDNSNSSFEGFLLNKCSPIYSGSDKACTLDPRPKSKGLDSVSIKPRHRSFVSSSPLDNREDTVPEKTRIITEISNSFGKYKVEYPVHTSKPNIVSSTPISRPLRSCQNYSKGFISPVYFSTFPKFKEEANVSRTMQQKSKKEKLKYHNRLRSVSSVEVDDNEIDKDLDCIRSKVDQIVLENAQVVTQGFTRKEVSGSSSLTSINLDDSDDESFEGFDIECNQHTSIDETIISNDILDDETQENKAEAIDLEDFIGENCNCIGCTISWLESGRAKSKPVKITNGVVYELNEFAKKIAWEPSYVAVWILRLRGYTRPNVEIQNEDMKKINYVIKRRKALSVTFAGYVTLKTKLSSFDSEPFSLASIEKLDKGHERKENILYTKPADNSQSFGVQDVKNVSKLCNKVSKPDKMKPGYNEINKNKVSEENTTDEYTQEDIESKSHSSENETFSSDNESLFNSDNDLLHDSDDDTFSISENDVSSLTANDPPYIERNDSSCSDAESGNKIENEKLRSTTVLHSQSPENIIKSSKGRVRKPTVKAQESYSLKLSHAINTSILDEVGVNKSPCKDVTLSSSEVFKPKLLHPIFKDVKVIGPHCKVSGIDIKLLNSFDKADNPITNGVVYELYHFFRERKASLTSLVHTLYRLKDNPIDKSHIIATMAKIHEMVKVMWEERLSKNCNMPFEEFNLPEPQNKLKNWKPIGDEKAPSKMKNEKLEDSEPQSKKRRLSDSHKPVTKEVSPESLETDSNSSDSNLSNSNLCEPDPPKESSAVNKTFDLNSTKGYLGKVTRGDIVYLYTKWLKKKMEGQSNVFVTDLSKDVEELIIDRKVEFIRIPVGTLMSSSVKLFEEFRKLSKINMYEAKMYLLEDWIEDIKSVLSSISKKKSVSDPGNEDENQEISKSSTASPLSVSVNENSECNTKITNIPSVKDQISFSNSLSTLENAPNLSRHSPKTPETTKPLIKNVSNEYEVEKIVGYRIVKIGEESVTEYRIRWAGFSSKDDSWINEADLNCPDILARFWEALNKQRASKIKTEPVSVAAVVKEKRLPSKSVLQGQENISPFSGRDSGSSQKFFNLMVQSLKPNLIDYQHEEERPFTKRVKISKGEVLSIYDKWRQENQEHLLTGGNQKVDVNVLISRVKDLIEMKRVRNFNPNCLIDVCYRMSLMKAKLKDAKKVDEYLSGDFIELMQVGQKHQDFVRKENSLKLKKIKQDKLMTTSTENNKFNEKMNTLCNLEKESLIIAKYMTDNRINRNIGKNLESEISAMAKVLEVDRDEVASVESLKKQNSSVVKELEACGVNEDTLDELLNIALKIN